MQLSVPPSVLRGDGGERQAGRGKPARHVAPAEADALAELGREHERGRVLRQGLRQVHHADRAARHLVVQQAAPAVVGGQGGGIVNLSSAAARLGAAGQYVDYAAAKGAIDSFTLGLGREVAAEGIRVNALRPGLIETEIHASGGLPDRVAQLAHQVPMQRGGTADEVAGAALFLASPAARFVTGAILAVDGGYLTL